MIVQLWPPTLHSAAGHAQSGPTPARLPVHPPASDISYFVPKPSWSSAPESPAHPGMIQLLCSVSAAVAPGQLMCLMGASGAGKTLLLDGEEGEARWGAALGSSLPSPSTAACRSRSNGALAPSRRRHLQC